MLPCPSKRGRRVKDVLVSPYVHEHSIRVASKVSYYCSGDHTVALPLEMWSSSIGRFSSPYVHDPVASKQLPRNGCLGLKGSRT